MILITPHADGRFNSDRETQITETLFSLRCLRELLNSLALLRLRRPVEDMDHRAASARLEVFAAGLLVEESQSLAVCGNGGRPSRAAILVDDMDPANGAFRIGACEIIIRNKVPIPERMPLYVRRAGLDRSAEVLSLRSALKGQGDLPGAFLAPDGSAGQSDIHCKQFLTSLDEFPQKSNSRLVLRLPKAVSGTGDLHQLAALLAIAFLRLLGIAEFYDLVLCAVDD